MYIFINHKSSHMVLVDGLTPFQLILFLTLLPAQLKNIYL